MGYNLDEFVKTSAQVRKLFYDDGYVCNRVDEYSFNQYISDNNSNNKVLDDAFIEQGIKLIVAPTGAGKSYALVESAKRVLNNNPDSLIVFALPSRALTEQLSNSYGIDKLVGGDTYNNNNMKLIATTFEKFFEIKEQMEIDKAVGRKRKLLLVIDECHLICLQQKFRQKSTQDLIDCIEKYAFSVLLVTATPNSMSLFRCNRILAFKSRNKKPVMDRIEILETEDVISYIKDKIDYNKELPFVRLCHKDLIDQLINEMPQLKIARLTASDKKSKTYLDIVNNSKIDSSNDLILTTNLLENGVSVCDFSPNTIPYVVIPNCYISADDIEQFLNRLRKNNTNHVECAKILLRKHKKKELVAKLYDFNNRKEVCTFQNLSLRNGTLCIKDIESLDSISDGEYFLIASIDGTTFTKEFTISSFGCTSGYFYSKADKKHIEIELFPFNDFIDILKKNLKNAERFCATLNQYADALNKVKSSRQSVVSDAQFADEIIDPSMINEDILVKEMILSSIQKSEFADCLTYSSKEVELNKRILYMQSYNEYQKQFYYRHDMLKKELESRLGVNVSIIEEETSRTKVKLKMTDEIWGSDEMEEARNLILDIGCNDSTFNGIMSGGNTFTRISKKYRDKINKIREHEEILQMMEELQNDGIEDKGCLLEILTKSKTRKDMTKYKNNYSILTMNKSLIRLAGMDLKNIQDIPVYNDEQKMQATIFFYLNKKGQTAYTLKQKVNKQNTKEDRDKLVNEIINYYRETYPDAKRKYTVTQVRKLAMKMYCIKDKKVCSIRNILKTKKSNIFNMEEAC